MFTPPNPATKNAIRKATYPGKLRMSRISSKVHESCCTDSGLVRNLEFVMSTNPYAPPVPSSDAVPAKRPFFKSGTRILFIAFLFGPLTIFLMSISVGTLLPTIIPHGVEIPEIVHYEGLMSRLVRGVSWSFVPVGTWVLMRSPVVLTVKKTRQIAQGTMVLALATAVCTWLITPLWYFGSIFYSPLAFIGEILRIGCTLGLLLVVYRIATSQSKKGIRVLSISAILLNILECVKNEFLDASASASVPWMIASTVFSVLVMWVFLATLWSARKLEDGSAELPLAPKAGKTKRRKRVGSQDENV